MDKQKPRDTPIVVIPSGYDLEDIIDTDESQYFYEKPILEEEVKIEFAKPKE